MSHEVSLDVFEGPIDLLLHLITRKRVDIYDVSLATITDEYLRAIAMMDAVDLEKTTGFLVVASTLLELKAMRLLPDRRGGELDAALLEERDMLLARLVECATFREAGTWLHGRLADGDSFAPRDVPLEDAFVDRVPDLLARTTAFDVAAAAGRLLVPKPKVELDTSHVAPITATVSAAIRKLAERLSGGDEVVFEELCGRDRPRIEVVVAFLALLEMFKAGAVEVTQSERFGSIRARWTGEAGVTEVLEDAEEYTLELGGAS